MPITSPFRGFSVGVGEGTSVGTAVGTGEGGAVGVGSEDARLIFDGDVKVYENILTGSTVYSNVYLNFDTDTIINFQSVGNKANIGIYVDDTNVPTRGVPSTRFGVYVTTISNTNLNNIKNDRTENMKVKMDPDAVGLDEVVVIGFGTVKKRDVTGAVAQVKSEAILQPFHPNGWCS